MAKLYKSEAWLRKAYRTKTAAQIATECGVQEKTISRYLTLFDIKINRSRGR